ncbi:MAG: peptidyl-prolyl cis-trans isomerase [Pseudomonadota bacterium]|nr:peptidyl-prolyl cis-trans isomerase [Pseudomonadota bacterium]
MFRSLGKSKIAFVLAILFGISLFFFKGGSRYSNLFNSDTVVATISGTPISTSKFNRTMQMNINKFNQMLGKPITGDEIRSFQIHSLSLGALINDAVFENEYDSIKLIIDESVVAQKTKERIPQLYDKNNKLNETYLNTFLKQQQLKIEDIVQIINFETRDEFVNNALFNINYPQYFSSKINNYNNHSRKISYIEFLLEEVNIENDIQKYALNMKEELEKYYENNINQYMSKENRNVEYIIFNKKKYANNFVPTNFEIKEYFNANKELYYQNEQRSFIQFNFKTLEEAKNFKSKIQNFINPSDILKFAEENNIRFNEFENLIADEMLEEISKPLFELNQNQQSKIIETSIAKHIIILQSIEPARQLKFDEVKENIKNTITAIELNNYFTDIKNQASEKILNGKLLSEIANDFNLTISLINNITQDYDQYDQSEEIIISSLIPAAFGSNKDFVSDVIDINNDYAYIFNVKEITPSTPLDITSIQEILLNDWKKSKKIEKINSDVKINKDNNNFFSQLLSTYQLQPKELIINNNFNELPRSFIVEVLEGEKGQNIQYIYNNLVHIAKIIDITIPDEKNDNISISMADDLRGSFGGELYKNKNMSTNDSLINAIIQQY